MDITHASILFIAGVLSGGLNAIVGGGAFIAFPALIFLGIPPISANATMTVSLWPGTLTSLFVQRASLRLHTRLLPVIIPLSLLGGWLGAITLIHTSNSDFYQIVPYMLLVACILFTWKEKIIHRASTLPLPLNHKSLYAWLLLITIQLLLSVYGGFFGAGMGIMYLACFSLLDIGTMHQINALRNCSAACINSIATIVFILSDKVAWLPMGIMCSGAIIGGYVCARYAQKLPAKTIYHGAILVAWIIILYLFWK